ncbi:C-C motif chemokine 20a.3 [Echeneis naucrates]|uniref:C-C motif chemokine 20a.3 n=1 Tax=Echeneis naucrates TaxID=173247 RepID=UPI0011134665|nr:C-C motif chemokine 20-like [Echeneis naucrates]
MMSIKLIVISLSICLLATHTSAVYVECCRRYMKTRVPFGVIRGYSVQRETELCPINAIIFHTKRGKACTDPAFNWVMEYVNRLRNAAQLVHKTSKVQK